MPSASWIAACRSTRHAKDASLPSSVGSLDLAQASQAEHDVGEDRLGILAARVVARRDRAVAPAGDGFGHRHALGAVAVAAAAEHRDEATARHRAHRAQQLVDGVGRVRVVDQHGRRVGTARDRRARHGRALAGTTRTPRTMASTGISSPTASPTATSRFSTLKSPISGSASLEWARGQTQSRARAAEVDVRSLDRHVHARPRLARHADRSAPAVARRGEELGGRRDRRG